MKINKRSLGLVLLMALTAIVFYKQVDLQNVVAVLKTIRLRFLFIGFACMLVFWSFEAHMLDLLVHKLSGKRKLWTSIKLTLIGQYYSFITPFASGGQPAQLYIMKKERIAASKGTVILAAKFIVFQVTVTLYSLFWVIVQFKALLSASLEISTFVFFGLTINTIGLMLIMMVALNPSKLKKMTLKVTRWLVVLHFMKEGKHQSEKIDHFISEYLEGVRQLKEDMGLTVYLFLLSVVQLTAFFSITFFVYRSLGLSGAGLFHIIALQSMLYMAVSFIPIPGTVGASEVGFALLLGTVFHGHFLAAGLLVWRVITYYFGLILSGLFSLAVFVYENSSKSVVNN
ncbi:MAG: flippase-like domain-containing protein [Clostridia bacterium]|nr:flippase-like domain-containing protein [Clostridia bacterium]